MMRSLFAGVSGLRNHQTRMDVIGNNIANVNTTGFKASSVNFQDMLSQTIQGASSPQGNIGGTNPMQVGLGMSIASIQTLFTDGSVQPTGQPTDLAISGAGFFILSDGSNQMYTRAGNFDFDTSGNFISLANGYKVMGYMADADGNINTNQQPSAITIPKGIPMAAKPSTLIEFAKNLSADAEIGTSIPTSMPIFDSLGNAHTVNQVFYKTGTNTWLVGTSLLEGSEVPTNRLKEITFTSTGEISSVKDVTADPANYNVGVTGLQLNETLGSVSSFTTTVLDEGMMSHKLTLEFTNTGTGTWDLAVKENNKLVANTTVGTGATNTPITVNGTTFNFNWKGGIAAATGDTFVTPTAIETHNVATVNGMVLNSTGSGGPFSATVNGSNLTFSFANTGTGAWDLTVSDGVNNTTISVAAGALSTSFNLSGKDFTFNWGAGGLQSGTATTTPTSIVNSQLSYTPGGAASPLSFTPVGADTLNFSLDFSGLSQYGGDTTAKAEKQDGYAAGTLDTVSVDKTGTIVGKFTNGLIKNLAQVSMASFNNPAGLTKLGDNMYSESNNSGTPQIGTAKTGGRGALTPGSLEMSNVDLAQEFSNMIITQRGFQANSKIITTTDEMLQDLTNLKR